MNREQLEAYIEQLKAEINRKSNHPMFAQQVEDRRRELKAAEERLEQMK